MSDVAISISDPDLELDSLKRPDAEPGYLKA
jgi:hypothetical protein